MDQTFVAQKSSLHQIKTETEADQANVPHLLGVLNRPSRVHVSVQDRRQYPRQWHPKRQPLPPKFARGRMVGFSRPTRVRRRGRLVVGGFAVAVSAGGWKVHRHSVWTSEVWRKPAFLDPSRTAHDPSPMCKVPAVRILIRILHSLRQSERVSKDSSGKRHGIWAMAAVAGSHNYKWISFLWCIRDMGGLSMDLLYLVGTLSCRRNKPKVFNEQSGFSSTSLVALYFRTSFTHDQFLISWFALLTIWLFNIAMENHHF